MKRIYASQRVETVPDYNERRDELDQNWASFLEKTNSLLFPLPNHPQTVQKILIAAPPDGILLTGGNTPVEYGGDSPQRDETDELLIKYAAAHKLPLIGVCRGLQSIVLHFGGSLKKVSGHVRENHEVKGNVNRVVNSFHNFAAATVPPCLEITARSEDGVIEAVRHLSLPIVAIMWHPEREREFNIEDIDLFNSVFTGRSDVL